MPEIEIVDNFLEPQQNPYEDRITAILQKRAQPQEFSPWQKMQAGRAAMAGAGYGGQNVEQILEAIGKPQREAEDRTLESTKGLYDLFEDKRARGDQQAQALFDRISLFTGGDPEGTSMFLEELHRDPESIDPGNAYQVMTKLANISRKTGYKPLDIRMKEAQIRASDALSKRRAEGGGGGSSVFALTMAAIDQDPKLSRLPTIDKIRLAQNKLGTNLTIGADGEVIDMPGAAEGVGALKGMEKLGGAIGEETGKGLIEERTKAREAGQTISSNAQARQLLDSGMITGFGADFMVNTGKALQQAGINFAADEVANTEAFIANRASEVGRVIKQFGAGTGLSDADREYAEKAAAGQIKLTEESLRKILDISDRAAQRTIKVYNDELSNIPTKLRSFDLSVQPPTPTKDDPLGIR